MCSWEVIIMKCLYMSASYSKSAITSTLVVLHVVVVNRTQSHNVSTDGVQVDNSGKRKVLATTSINMVRYASSMPYDHDLHLRLKPTSRKVKTVMLEVSLNSKFLKEGKAT